MPIIEYMLWRSFQQLGGKITYPTKPSHHLYLVTKRQKTQFKMCKGLEQTFLQRRYKNGLFSSVQLLNHVPLFETPWIAAHQASLSITNSWNSPKLMCIESVMTSNYLILCHPLLLLPTIPPTIRVFSNESTLPMRWPNYWSFSFSIIPSKEIPGLISLQFKGLSRVLPNTTIQKHQFFGAQLSSQSNSHIHIWPLEKP